MNYREDIKIDPDQLDVEWLEQSELFCNYGEEQAKAEKEVDRLEEKVKVTRSKLISEANKNPEVMGEGVKPTAPNVEAYYRTHPDHQEAKKELNEAKYQRDILKVAVQGFRQRKDALEELVKLHGQSYFSGPIDKRNLSKEYKKRREERAEKREAGAKVSRGEQKPETEREKKKRIRAARKKKREEESE